MTQFVGEGGQGGIMRIDFSLDGKWVRGEARSTADTSVSQSTVIPIILSAESGDVCQNHEVSVF